MPVTTAFAVDILKAAFENTPMPNYDWHLALWYTNPGALGTSGTEVADTNYARVRVAWDPITGNLVQNKSDKQFTEAAAFYSFHSLVLCDGPSGLPKVWDESTLQTVLTGQRVQIPTSGFYIYVN